MPNLSSEYTNNLDNSASPYLLQHAHNPVNWQIWDEQIWETAKKENKLVLVSIGYSACHWCHVMEKECFEDTEVAQLMNAHFINIKVDKEERPDIDAIYMDACQLMSGRGGWPLNAFCTPNKIPIYAGTYFPKKTWLQILTELQHNWEFHPENALAYEQNMKETLENLYAIEEKNNEQLKKIDLPLLYENFSKRMDYNNGGMGHAPKFPMPNQYQFLFDYFIYTKNKNAQEFAVFSLLKMCSGGIFDFVRGGFYRYSVDEKWFAPHFEKMLYDNALLLKLYARAFSETKAEIFLDTCNKIYTFCTNELLAKNQLFYSALDADSNGEEGAFYTYTFDELKVTLDDYELKNAEIIFAITEDGNWEHGKNILHKKNSPAQITSLLNLPFTEINKIENTIIEKIKKLQQTKAYPTLDYKHICAWNGLMLSGLSVAALHLENNQIKNTAIELAIGMKNNFYEIKNLYRIISNNKKYINGFLEDYAFFIEGLIDLYALTWDENHLFFAQELMENCIANFYQFETHCFYFSGKNNETIISSKQDLTDDVTNSPNAVLVRCLLKLGYYFENTHWIEIANIEINRMNENVLTKTSWYSYWAQNSLAQICGFIQITIFDKQLQNEVLNLVKHLPSTAVIANVSKNSLLPIAKNKLKEGIYVCINETCFEPVDSLDKMNELIEDYAYL